MVGKKRRFLRFSALCQIRHGTISLSVAAEEGTSVSLVLLTSKQNRDIELFFVVRFSLVILWALDALFFHLHDRLILLSSPSLLPISRYKIGFSDKAEHCSAQTQANWMVAHRIYYLFVNLRQVPRPAIRSGLTFVFGSVGDLR